jgi:hypothetical protein
MVPPRLQAVTFDAQDAGRLARFWAGVLGRAVSADHRGPWLAGSETQVGLRFAPGRAPRTGPDRVHVHLTSTSPAGQQDTIVRALELGAHHLDVGQRPEEGHVVLADPEGHAFCVIEPGNAFLAGCGFLGELACEGTRQVGIFWSAALGWPLVWDENGETAIQSPHGGTKVAWGGPPVTEKQGRNRQRFDLTVAGPDLASEVDRLVALGALRSSSAGDGSIELTDPDGNEFSLTPG